MRFTVRILPLVALAAALGTTGALAQQNQPKPTHPGGTQSPAQSSAMDMKTMKAEMEQMRAQMEQMQTLMKDSMAKMEAADAAMKSHMETEQASMKSQMELQHAVINQLQNMTDHMQKMHEGMAMMPGPMEMHKK
jgi:hypothetical protein